jgi:hypothetical protein
MKNITTRIKVLIGLFVLTGSYALYIIFQPMFKESSFAHTFQSIDTTNIQRIDYTYKGTDHQLVVKTKTKWVIDDTYEIRTYLIDLVKQGFSRLTSKMPVPKNNQKYVMDYLKKNGVKIKITTEQGVQEIYIITNENDLNSSWYLQEGASEPYVVYVPGVDGDVSNLFKLGAVEWRSKTLFKSSPGSLQKLIVNYPNSKTDGFEIEFINNNYVLKEVDKLDSSRFFNYLSQYEQVSVSKYLVGNQKDSVENLLKTVQPEAYIYVTDKDIRYSEGIGIYKMRVGDKVMYGRKMGTKELVELNPQYFLPLLVKKALFMDK